MTGLTDGMWIISIARFADFPIIQPFYILHNYSNFHKFAAKKL
jgi:hypothetical protein